MPHAMFLPHLPNIQLLLLLLLYRDNQIKYSPAQLLFPHWKTLQSIKFGG